MALLDALPHKERLAHDKLQNMQGVNPTLFFIRGSKACRYSLTRKCWQGG